MLSQTWPVSKLCLLKVQVLTRLRIVMFSSPGTEWTALILKVFFTRISTERTDGDCRKDDLLNGDLEDRCWGRGVGPVSAHKERHEERHDEAEGHNQKPDEIDGTSITPSTYLTSITWLPLKLKLVYRPHTFKIFVGALDLRLGGIKCWDFGFNLDSLTFHNSHFLIPSYLS